MGGLANYRDAFFTSDFLQNNPNSLEHVNKLRILIVEQVYITSRLQAKRESEVCP